MAIVEPYMTKTVEGDEDLSLTMDTGESAKVLDILVDNPASDYVEASIKRTSVGYFRVGGTQGNHLPYFPVDEENKTIYSKLLEDGLIRPIPIAEGQTLTLKGAAQSGARQTIVYQLNEAGDFTSDMPNGSEAAEYDAILYGNVSGGAGAGENLYDTLVNPEGYVDFPFEADAPANTVVTIKGFILADVGKTTGGQADQQGTEYLKVVSGRETYYSPTGEGLQVEGEVSTTSDVTNVGQGNSLVGAYSSADQRPYFVLPEPEEYTAGEELDYYIATEIDSGSANFVEGDVELGLIATIAPA